MKIFTIPRHIILHGLITSTLFFLYFSNCQKVDVVTEPVSAIIMCLHHLSAQYRNVGLKRPLHGRLKACLHIPMPLPIPFPSPSKFIVVLMVTGRLSGRMGSRPILPVRQPVTIGTITKLDGDGNGIGAGIGMCKQALST